MDDRLKEVDGLRAIAVIAVVVFHFGKQYLPLGYLGVDVFFAISGYVISKSIWDRLDEGCFTFNDFYMRRIRRLFPALAVVITASILGAAFIMTSGVPIATGASAFVGASNLYLWSSGSNYFTQSAELNPLTHTWSLGVEEQFYLIFPCVLYLAWKRSLNAFWLLAPLALSSLVCYYAAWHSERVMVFYLMPFRIWELSAGSLICLLHRKRAVTLNPRLQGVLKYGFLLSMVAMLFWGYLREDVATGLCILCSSGVLYLSGRGAEPNLFLRNHFSIFIGKISYSVYLWHWPVLVVSKLLLAPQLVLPAYILLTAVLSIFSYYGIERPLRQRRWTWFRDRILLALPICVASAATACVVVWIAKPWLYRGPKEMMEVQFLRHSPCHIPGKDGLLCLKENFALGGSILLVGDSHAGNLSVPLRDAARSLGVGFQFLTGRTLFLSLMDECTATSCPEGSFVDLAKRLELVSKPGDVVVLSFARDRFQEEDKLETFRTNLISFSGELESSHLKIVLVEDIPKVCRDDAAYIQSAFRREACEVPEAESRRGRERLSAIYRRVGAGTPVTTVDPHDLLCETLGGQRKCSNWLGGQLLYLDSSPHLSLRAANSLTGFFAEKLQPLFTKN